MIYGYIRVSTDRQNTENQKFEIRNFAKQNNMIINEWIEEKVSSTQDLQKRKLGKLIGRAKEGDLIIASELSRLGRNLLQVMGMLNHLMNTGVRVWTIKDGYKLGDDISSKVLAFAFGLSAEIERKLISERTKEALARIKADGKALGRPAGRRNNKSKLANRASYVRRLLSLGYSQAEAARRLGVHRATLAEFLKATGSKNPLAKPV
jgi:DNA invertase Pin-like site-specific DNA recombinase